MNCFERNKQHLKLYPGFNGKPMQITKKSRHLFLSQTKHSEKNTSTDMDKSLPRDPSLHAGNDFNHVRLRSV